MKSNNNKGTKMIVRFEVNHRKYEMELNPGRRLLDVLREDLGLCGAKESCGLGECGACTVLLDGRPVNSCLVMVGSVMDRKIITIEGISGKGANESGSLHPIQRAFVESGAVQCGFCTPGLIMNLVPFVESRESAEDDEIRRYIAGNLCRCTGYVKIVEAVQSALKWKREGQWSNTDLYAKEKEAHS